MSLTVLLVILFVVALLALASLPFAHKWWTSRPGYQSRRSRYQPPIPPQPDSAQPDSAQPDSAQADSAPPDPADSTPADSTAADTPPTAAEPTDAEPTDTPPTAAEPANKFRFGLAKARSSIGRSLSAIGRRGVDQQTWDQLTDALILADVGINTATEIIEQLRSTAQEQRITEGSELLAALNTQMLASLQSRDRSLNFTPAADTEPASPTTPTTSTTPTVPVWLFVGVNGVGKTTSIGKIGHQLQQDGRRAVFAAADTFRAAASEQLSTWAQRSDGYLVSGSVGADPGSVIHDSVAAAAARSYDIVLADTAGRLQNKSNLMSELAKIRRVADKAPGCVTEVLLVIDATTGQNGLSQAESFTEAADVTGVVLTKLDGSAKGGIVFAIESQFDLPVKLVGLGESATDLVEFQPETFLTELLGEALTSQN